MTRVYFALSMIVVINACQPASQESSYAPESLSSRAIKEDVARAEAAGMRAQEASPLEPEPAAKLEPVAEPEPTPEPVHLREALPPQKISRVLNVRTQLQRDVEQTVTHHEKDEYIYYHDRYDNKQYGADTDIVRKQESFTTRVECGFGVQLDQLRTYYQVRTLSTSSDSDVGGFDKNDEIFSKCLFLKEGDEVHIVKHTLEGRTWYAWRISTQPGANEGELE